MSASVAWVVLSLLPGGGAAAAGVHIEPIIRRERRPSGSPGDGTVGSAKQGPEADYERRDDPRPNRPVISETPPFIGASYGERVSTIPPLRRTL